MPQFLKSKHQKLILQCYPSGRDIDKKPNSSELSYLLYYASTRRVKLEKVGNFLERKTISDLRHYSRYGNVQVSLLIIKNLIEKCSDNLNVFANNAVIIFKSTLLSNDLILAQLTLKVFKVFCKNLDNNLFVGDQEFVHNFTEVCELFLDLGSRNYKSENAVNINNQWQILSIKAAKYLSSIAGFNISKKNSESKALQSTHSIDNGKPNGNEVNNLEGDYLVNNSLGLILSILKANFTTEDLIEKLASIESRIHKRTATTTTNNGISTTDLQITKSNVTMRRSVSISRLSNAGGDNLGANDVSTDDNINLDTEWSDLDCAEDALVALKSYFRTTISFELNTSMKAINNFIYNRYDKEMQEWANVLIQIIVNWVPVQLRFLVLTFLINRLLKISDLDAGAMENNQASANINKGNTRNATIRLPDSQSFNYQIMLTYIISGLLNSKVNMIGLSILDILKNLLNLQSSLVVWNLHDSENEQIYGVLAYNYTNCISNLSKHIYYHDQISDIIEELLIRLNDTFTYNISSKDHKDEVNTQIFVLFNDIDSILNNGISKANGDVENNDEMVELYGEQLLRDDVNAHDKKSQQQLVSLIKQKVSVFINTWLSFSLYLNHEQYFTNKTILFGYYRILIKFLSIELGIVEERSLEQLLSNEKLTYKLNKLQRTRRSSNYIPKLKSEFPNYSNLILNNLNNNNNFLNELLRNFDNILTGLVSSSGEVTDFQLLKYLLISKIFVLEIFGINFIFNALQYFFNWQYKSNDLQEIGKDATGVLKDSFGYNLLLKSAQYLKIKSEQDESLFQEESNSFDTFLNAVIAKVNTRIEGNIWDSEIPLDAAEVKANSVSGDNANFFNTGLTFSKQDLLDFFNQSRITNKWIVEVLTGEHVNGNQQKQQQLQNQGGKHTGNGNTINLQNTGFENASILSSSKLLANLTNNNNTILSTNLTGTWASLNRKGSFTPNGDHAANSLRAHDLKRVLSKNSLQVPTFRGRSSTTYSSAQPNAEQPANENAAHTLEQAESHRATIDDLKKFVAGLSFNKDKFSDGKIDIEV